MIDMPIDGFPQSTYRHKRCMACVETIVNDNPAFPSSRAYSFRARPAPIARLGKA